MVFQYCSETFGRNSVPFSRRRFLADAFGDTDYGHLVVDDNIADVIRNGTDAISHLGAGFGVVISDMKPVMEFRDEIPHPHPAFGHPLNIIRYIFNSFLIILSRQSSR